MKRSLIIFTVLALIIALTAPAMASTTQESIIKLQAKDLVPVSEITKTDVDSSRVWSSEELVYFGGSYYLPLEKALQFLGGAAYWNGTKWVINHPGKQWDPLKYYLSFDYEQRELVLTVYNPQSYPVKLTFTSGKTHDFIITRDGQKVWQLSDDQQYTQQWSQEVINAWGVKTYRTEIPQLPAGSYEAHALFEGGNSDGIVASTDFYNFGPATDYSNLSHSLRYKSGNWNDSPKMVFTTRNTSDKDVTQYFWSNQPFDLVIKNNEGTVWQFSDGKEFKSGFQSKTISAGGLSSKYIYIPDLEPGRYVSEAYDYSISKDWPVATTVFYVR